MAAATSWTGTWFHDEGTDLEQYLSKLYQDGKVAFCIGQEELCPSTGRKHLQFYVQLGRTCTMKWLKKYVNEHAHWEKARGTVDENIQYCSKQDTQINGPWQFGTPKRTGKLTGLDEATMLVTSGTPLGEVAKAFPVVWVRHGKGLVHLRQALSLDADRRQFGPEGPELWVLIGPSGAGKSRYANEHWPKAFWKAPYSQWWDGYTNQDTVVLDDFKDDTMRLTDLQRLIDHYPYWVEIKGGSVPMLATRYVITSNKHPEEWYIKADTERTIMRRVYDFAERHGRLLTFPLTPPATEIREGFADWPDHPWDSE
ncbi:MAG: Rep [Angristvirus hurin]|uniref:ATP-dependent helicase Rep n=1 Tax=Circular ssDNA virus sp. TaxID=2805939 RepID=A0ABM6WNH5_9VIRU|nr:MAG: Rep [Circular ssDNA virus sp.]AWU66059.1 MAG: Rep [Circular ssDNA virus sp.]